MSFMQPGPVMAPGGQSPGMTTGPLFAPQHPQPGGGQMQGGPVQAPGNFQMPLNRLGQVRGFGNWGPGSQWYQNHNGGQAQGGPVQAPGQFPIHGFPPMGGQMQGGPAMLPPGLLQALQGGMSGMGGQMFPGGSPGGPPMAPMPGGQFGAGQGGGPQLGPNGMPQQQWQQLLARLQGDQQQGGNPFQRGFYGQMTQ